MMDDKDYEAGETSDNLDTLQAAALLGNPEKESQDIPFCGCLSVRYYQPFFDVDTKDIFNRIANAVLYCRREQNFVAFVGEKPDAYGPFWIATTLIFMIAVSSHLNSWFAAWLKGGLVSWEYNFQSILTASSVVFGFVSICPSLIWFIFRQYEPNLKFITIFCLYGYSMFVFIPAVIISFIPSETLSWVVLISASVASSLFLLRNLAPFVMVHAKKQAALLLGLVGSMQILFMFWLKFNFFFNGSIWV